MSYELLCHCGRALKGSRQRRHQVLSCPACGRPVFVLPLSAFSPEAPAAPRRWWRAPLIAGVASLALLLVAFAVAMPLLGRPEKEKSPSEQDADAREYLDTGRRLLRQGKCRSARQALDAALRRRQSADLSADEHRDLNQLHRQADLLGRLLPMVSEGLVRRARLARNADEWALLFEDYRGKSVVFDDLVGRDENDRPALAYVARVGDESVRLAVDDLDVLRDLPLESLAAARKTPELARMIFGGRISAVEREAGGGWAVRFVSISGVLFTDAEAVRAAQPWPPDEGLERVLERQRRWLGERVAQPAAKP